MTAKNFSIVVLGNNDELPVVSGAKARSVGQLVKYFRSLAGGARTGAVTVRVRNTAVKASGTVTPATAVVGNTVTINGTALTAAQRHATGTATIVIANLDVDDTITVNGYAFTAKSSETLASGFFDISGTATAAATSLVACVTASTNVLISGVITAKSLAGVVTFRYETTGVAGNSITLVSSDADGAAVTGSGFLTGGLAEANNTFDFTGTNAQTAVKLAAAINASTTGIIVDHVSAVAASGVCTISSLIPGVCGNAITLASSGSTLAVSGSGRITGGTETLISFTF